MERANGAMVGAKPYVDNDNWTEGICAYSGLADPTDPVALHSCVGRDRVRRTDALLTNGRTRPA
jgi:hypothetical protein